MKQLSIPYISNFNQWEDIPKLTDFTYPWREEKVPYTSFSAYYNDAYIHFRFEAAGPSHLIYVNDNNKLEVIHSERVEIFFRSNEEMKPYYCLEMDPNGRVLDYRANYYREFERDWQWPDSLHIKTTIDETGYTLEGKLSFESLKALGVLQNDKIQIGLYRGHCTAIENNKGTIKWISWVDSKTDQPDFHVPSSFGVLNLLSREFH